MNGNHLKYFEIKNLFHQFDVKLPLEENINIFLGENGMGKTTILNCLYYVLSGNMEKLNAIVFDEVIVAFKNNSKIELKHQDITAYVEEYIYSPLYRRRHVNIEGVFSEKELLEIKNIIEKEDTDTDSLKKYCYKLMDIYRLSPMVAKQELHRYVVSHLNKKDRGDFRNVIDFKKQIEENLDQEILYFPTYRRIEEDMSNLGIDVEEDRVKNRLIRFGMADVEKATEKILSTIRSAAINGFTKMTGVLLKRGVGL